MYIMTTNNSISFVMEGTEQVLSMRAKISVALEDIVSVHWYDTFNEWPHMQVRMPGTYMPRWIMAGSYWSDEGWDFVFAKKPKGMTLPLLYNMLVVVTKKDRYRRIIVQISEEKVQEVLEWWDENAPDISV